MYSIQRYVIKFVSDLRQIGGFLRVLRFPLPTGSMRGGSVGSSIRGPETQEDACEYLKGPIALAIDVFIFRGKVFSSIFSLFRKIIM